MVTQPVTMLYTLLHMHQAGKTITTRHIRGKQELPPLGTRSVWDFNHQEAAPIPLASRQLLPGDALITRCTYDTSSRANWTRWGEGTTDEMCFDFVLYYPRLPDLEFCATNPTPVGWNTSQPVDAICGSVTAISRAQGNITHPTEAQTKEIQERLTQAGVLVKATWPFGYRTYKDPRCRAAYSPQPQPRVQAASSANTP